MELPILRGENNPSYAYIKEKTEIEACPNAGDNHMCGVCWWKGVTIDPSQIPECSTCKADTDLFSSKLKAGAKKIELDVSCFEVCVWWSWFHSVRKMKIGCECPEKCTCGKIKYVVKSDAKQPQAKQQQAKQQAKQTMAKLPDVKPKKGSK